ncbi:MAG: DMT transporter permease [marine bacterium B5-7]|nr:MAG: DMT transporter permease [marine bacterium B5-7]
MIALLDTEPGARARGVLYMVVAVAFLAAMDTCAKYLSSDYHVMQILWVRYIGHFVIALVIFAPRMGVGMLTSRRPGLQWVRSGLMLVASGLNFIALGYLQLDQVGALAMTAPIWVVVLAVPLLGERITGHRLIAIIAGFTGIVLITRPGFGEVHWAIFLSLGTAVALALFQITTRMLANIDNHIVTQVYTTLAGVVILTPMVPFYWQTPHGWDWLIMLCIGGFGILGHYCLIFAHRYAPASVLAPFFYVQIVWMTGLGFLIFSDVPDVFTLLGAVVVVLSGLYIWKMERRTAKATP